MIENRNSDKPAEQPTLELICAITGVRTQKVDWATKVVYDIALRSLDKNTLLLGAVKAQQKVKITVEFIDGAEEANQEREFK